MFKLDIVKRLLCKLSAQIHRDLKSYIFDISWLFRFLSLNKREKTWMTWVYQNFFILPRRANVYIELNKILLFVLTFERILYIPATKRNKLWLCLWVCGKILSILKLRKQMEFSKPFSVNEVWTFWVTKHLKKWGKKIWAIAIDQPLFSTMLQLQLENVD